MISAINLGNYGLMGRYVAIYHPLGQITTVYCHLNAVASDIEVMQMVSAGDSIGTLGASVFGSDYDPVAKTPFDPPHLHFFVLGPGGHISDGAAGALNDRGTSVSALVETPWGIKVTIPGHTMLTGRDTYFYFTVGFNNPPPTTNLATVYPGRVPIFAIDGNDIYCPIPFVAGSGALEGGAIWRQPTTSYLPSAAIQKLIMQVVGVDTESVVYGAQGKSLQSQYVAGHRVRSTNVTNT
jgi:murein DD-endopeptidase MepM/ murein hydrolase activator NlpD